MQNPAPVIKSTMSRTKEKKILPRFNSIGNFKNNKNTPPRINLVEAKEHNLHTITKKIDSKLIRNYLVLTEAQHGTARELSKEAEVHRDKTNSDENQNNHR